LVKIYRTRLLVRIAVLIAAILLYVRDKGSFIITNNRSLFIHGFRPIHFFWIILMAAMIPKFFPQKGNSMGCRKQFKSSFEPSTKKFIKSEIDGWTQLENKAAIKVFALWFIVNAVIAFLYYAKILGQWDMVLLSLFYFVCDMICLLVWCPFQYFIMKNRCCVTCRIFNWDSIMVCTPLIFIRGFFSWSLVAVAFFLLIRWEYSYWKHPLRFFEGSNENLQCKHCKEKICKTKRLLDLRNMHSRSI
jgi:hypothetical protein